MLPYQWMYHLYQTLNDPIQVVTNGVAELLKSLEVHKAAGPDEIPA